MYHWLFVPLTLGLSFIIAFMETLYVRSGNPEWKRITKFWMTLFGINFAIGIATGIILEFEFGTNWSNYSWFVVIGVTLTIMSYVSLLVPFALAYIWIAWRSIDNKKIDMEELRNESHIY